MSGGILRFPWTSQPQIPTGIDYGNPITSGLVFLTLPGLRQANIVDGKSFGGSKGTIEAGSKGIGAYAPTSTTYPTVTATLGQNYTLFSFGNVTTSGVAGSMIDDDDGSTRAFLFRIIASGAPDFTPFTAANAPVGITGSVFTAAQLSAGVAVAATMNSSGSGAVWGNGVKTTGSLGAAPRSPSTTIALLNRKSGGTQIPTTKPVYICAGWNRVLSDGEIASLSANPWQLFTPIQRTIWVPAAAGGATYTLTADSGSFALTGQDAGLAFNRTLAAASGSFALTGQDAGLAFNRVLSAANGSYALDGQDVTLTYTPISGATYTLGAASGSFALTGQDTGLAFNRVLTADTQSYSLSGDVAGLAFNRVLAADTVSYALTGQDVTLTYTSNGFTYTLTAESGSFEVTGQDASLRHTTTAIAGGGGWLPQTRRKSRKQIYEERVKLGILPPPVIKAAAKVAAVAQTVEEFKEERPKYEEMFLKAIKKTEWLPDYTRAIQAQLAIMEQEEEELLLLL